jgi:glutaredoxin-like protein NrdH
MSRFKGKFEMNVTMYSKPGCQACTATKRALDRHGIAYAEVDITADHHAAQRLREMGSLELPRIEVTWYDGRDSWTGFRPSKIEQLRDKISA